LAPAGGQLASLAETHTSLEVAASLGEGWKGAVLHQLIRIQFRRNPRDKIPMEPGARIAWLREEWQQLGAWVESHRSLRW
jgi:hypothetical protein